MGKKKIDCLKYIENKGLRSTAYTIRKRGLLKKLIEMSSMCGLQSYAILIDRDRKKIVEFSSDPSVNIEMIIELKNLPKLPGYKNNYETRKYTNNDY